MKVLLKETVAKLGNAGDVVEVKDGFAQNFLIPAGRAVPLTKANLADVQQKQKSRVKKDRNEAGRLSSLKKKLAGQKLELVAKASPEGKLYASIKRSDFVKAVVEKFKVDLQDKDIIKFPTIKKAGEHEVTLGSSGDTFTVIVHVTHE